MSTTRQVGTYTTIMENLDCHNPRLLSNTIGTTSDNTSTVSSMTTDVLELGLGVSVVSVDGTTFKVGVLRVDSRVDNVGPGVGSRRVLVDILAPVGGSVGDGAETPGGICLNGVLEEVDDADGFNGGDLVIVSISRRRGEMASYD